MNIRGRTLAATLILGGAIALAGASPARAQFNRNPSASNIGAPGFRMDASGGFPGYPGYSTRTGAPIVIGNGSRGGFVRPGYGGGFGFGNFPGYGYSSSYGFSNIYGYGTPAYVGVGSVSPGYGTAGYGYGYPGNGYGYAGYGYPTPTYYGYGVAPGYSYGGYGGTFVNYGFLGGFGGYRW